MTKIKQLRAVFFGVAYFIVFLAVGCSAHQPNSPQITEQNWVVAGDPKTFRWVGDTDYQYAVLGEKAFEEEVSSDRIRRTEREINPGVHTNPISLLFGMPFKMLNQPLLLGSVIVGVSDRVSEDLGGLKMADLPPLQVKAVIHPLPGTQNTYSLSVVSCEKDCENTTEQRSLFEIPVRGFDFGRKIVILDLSKLGKELDLVAIREGDPVLEKFKPKSSQTVRYDFSRSTLVFDIEAHLIDQTSDLTDSNANETVLTNRWFLKPVSSLNSSFTSRRPVPGVGFFIAERSEEPWIQRWDLDRRGAQVGIQYFLKHVPKEFQAAFAGAFDEWNEKLMPVVGKKIFSYEFLSDDDPRNDLIVTGDPRYNVLEWDLDNKAGYGGLGPSLANPYTGEIFQASVLVQGPTIVDLYSKWFNSRSQAKILRAMGRGFEADAVLAETQRELAKAVGNLRSRAFQLSIGKKVNFQIRSQQKALEDPLFQKEPFDLIPEGYDFASYMEGYFHDLVAHELGHNLGLRHNFMGNLGAKEGSPMLGGVSRSIMEYLGRGFRHLDRIGEYDVMAISYGYSGALPERTDWFCTDEEVADLAHPGNSAECSRDDATQDPFSYHHSQLSRVVDLLIARGKSESPDWVLDDLKEPIKTALVGMGAYVMSADQTFSKWQNFLLPKGRPQKASEVREYVLRQVKSVLCSPNLAQELNQKGTSQAREKALTNLKGLRDESSRILTSVFAPEELICSTSI